MAVHRPECADKVFMIKFWSKRDPTRNLPEQMMVAFINIHYFDVGYGEYYQS